MLEQWIETQLEALQLNPVIYLGPISRVLDIDRPADELSQQVTGLVKQFSPDIPDQVSLTRYLLNCNPHKIQSQKLEIFQSSLTQKLTQSRRVSTSGKVNNPYFLAIIMHCIFTIVDGNILTSHKILRPKHGLRFQKPVQIFRTSTGVKTPSTSRIEEIRQSTIGGSS
jgi:hypothetical protein